MTVVLYAVEGSTDAPVAEKLISLVGCEPRVVSASGGSSVIDAKLGRWCQPSNGRPMLIVRDWDQADRADCPAELVGKLTNPDRPINIALRIAVRSIESWLMADRDAATDFFRTPSIPENPDSLDKPKLALVSACRKSKLKTIRLGMTPTGSGGGTVGTDYVRLLTDFARDHWDPQRAATKSPSLDRTLARLSQLVDDGWWAGGRGDQSRVSRAKLLTERRFAP